MNAPKLLYRVYSLLVQLVDTLHNISLKRGVRWLFSVLALFFCGLYLYKNSKTLTVVFQLDQINVCFFLISTLLVWFAILSGSIVWYLILKSFGATISLGVSTSIHLYSNIAKYVPGMVWQYLVKYTSFPSRENKRAIPAIAIFVEFSLTIVTGIITTIFLFSETFSVSLWTSWLSWLGFFFFLIVLVIPFIMKTKIKKIDFYPIYFLLAYLLLLLNWNVLGASFWLVSNSLQYVPINNLPLYTFSLTSSIIGGILALPVPQGIGVREGLMIFFLQRIAHTPNALILTIISRLQITFGELFTALMAWLISRIFR